MKSLSMVAVVSLASAAVAQPAAMLSYRASLDGVSWFSTVTANTGDRVHVAAFLSVQGAFGIAGAVFNINISGALTSDTADIASPGLGRQVPWTFGAQALRTYTTAGGLRIDATNDAGDTANRGISCFQRDPSSSGGNYDEGEVGLVFRFDVVAGAGPARTLDVFTRLEQIKNGVIVYHSGPSSTRGTNTPNISTQGATVQVVPVPGVLGVMVACAIIVPRRRRA